jgi:spore coat polysaccharide biosynthesis protein SpsF
MQTIAVIQARMGSTRLPGKVMLPLANSHVLQHVINRVNHAEYVDRTVVATSLENRDDIIARFVPRFGAEVYRGSETDVLNRMFEAASKHDADTVVRLTADCPLLESGVIDMCLRRIRDCDVDYCSNIQKRTFPRGLDVEAFTFESFARLNKEATEPHHREHVTPYYRENPDEFDMETVTSEMTYKESEFQNRTDLRLTLDEAADYDLLNKIYTDIPFEEILSVKDAIRYVDEHNLGDINRDINQKSIAKDAPDDSS